jgi:hypothetical protein
VFLLLFEHSSNAKVHSNSAKTHSNSKKCEKCGFREASMLLEASHRVCCHFSFAQQESQVVFLLLLSTATMQKCTATVQKHTATAKNAKNADLERLPCF